MYEGVGVLILTLIELQHPPEHHKTRQALPQEASDTLQMQLEG
jgi:hypothetical protein